jgi:hypothetical protein
MPACSPKTGNIGVVFYVSDCRYSSLAVRAVSLMSSVGLIPILGNSDDYVRCMLRIRGTADKYHATAALNQQMQAAVRVLIQ